VLDRWLVSETQRLVRDVTAAYETFDTQLVGRLVTAFVDDLSNWYVRRSRRRFWEGDAAALATLHDCLDTVTRLMAPLVPFVTERVWQDLVRAVDPAAPDSVHLASWPAFDASSIDDGLAAQVALVRRVVELGRAARAEGKVRGRQPLGRAVVQAPGWDALPDGLRRHVAEELNVAAFETLAGDLVDRAVKPSFRDLGRRFGKDTPKVAAAIAAADAGELAGALRATGSATVVVDGAPVTVEAAEVVVTETPREGWSVATEAGETVALDLRLTPELVAAGLAREVVRLVQEARKASGLEVTDRFALRWASTDEEVTAALRAHAATVAAEVLATSMSEGLGGDGVVHREGDLGLTFQVVRASVG
jgi:isoleucyl-tRNA synthetase